MPNKNQKFILWFNETGIKDVPLVGGKNASLGEMYQHLVKQGVNIPNGFSITAYAYRYFMKKTKTDKEIKKILKGLDTKKISDLRKRALAVRQAILNADLPEELIKEIKKSYEELCRFYKMGNADVAVRSSATAEDLPSASFAGQQETFLNIRGAEAVLKSVIKSYASLFTDRAISYREDKGFDHFKIALSTSVQKMVRSDKAASGIMFTLDTESGFRDLILISSIYGLGENIVQGLVNPDEFFVFKPSLRKYLSGKKINPVISRQLGSKNKKMIYSDDPHQPTKNIPVGKVQRNNFSINQKEIIKLAEWGLLIEKHYKRQMDIEWAKDGESGQLFIVQARPETIHSVKNPNVLERYVLDKKGKILCSGHSVGEKIGQGKVKKIINVKEINKFKAGEVLVTEMTDPDWEPVMKLAAAIVTDSGGRTCFSGDTKIFTNKGFITFKDLKNYFNGREKLFTPSLNRETFKIEWREIIDIQQRKAEVIKVNFSQTGRQKDNYLKVTPDHKFLTLESRQLIERKIKDLLENKEMALVARHLPLFNKKEIKIDKRLAYLWGAIFTDGSVYLSRTHGEVQFIQKPTAEKKLLIATVQKYFKELFNKDLGVCIKKQSTGYIRGKKVIGEANAYRCYSKTIAQQFRQWQEELVVNMLNSPREVNLSFLAGVIDGDGTYNPKTKRIHIFCSSGILLQAIMISCLKIGIVPQAANNRSIVNIQILENLEEIFQYTKRVNGLCQQKLLGTNLFSAKQLLEDIKHKINYKGQILPYINNNLLLDGDKIKDRLIPMVAGQVCNHELTKIVNSDFKMLRASFEKKLTDQSVFNITVKDNHNYLVFTSKYTPLIVNNCHAAIVSREFGIPCVVGAKNATQVLKNGQAVTVSAAEGEEGFVYSGLLPFKIAKTNLKKIRMPKVKIMMNVGNPRTAFEDANIPNNGVGLAREEFIINSYIKIHPLALLSFDKLKDQKAKEQIAELTFSYQNKPQFFVDKLAEGIAMIAAAFYPKDVIVRLSDFKSNEYANLIGGREFEPEEGNPMIGWRGASRYYDPKYLPGFKLECQALKRVREEMGFDNVKIMIPFCRTVDEGKKVIKIMAEHGLKRGVKGLEIYVMCEIPSNVISGEEFAKIFDGFSIGSNDLTQLTLGVDRDSALVAHIYNERNQAVKDLIKQIIKIAHKHKRKVGICGQAPSDFTDFAAFLVKEGIDSMSLTPDTVIKTILSLKKIKAK